MLRMGRWWVVVLAGAGACAGPVVLTGCGGAVPPPADAADEALPVCGPQTPRDVSRPGGTNPIPVPGDGSRPPRLCWVHFHQPAEHTGIGACPRVETGDEGVCAPDAGDGGEGAGPVRPGDEIEVHWVYTNCPEPSPRRPGLDNCVCDRPQDGPDAMVLMAEARKYVVAPDGTPGAESELREPTGELARFGGSVTGPEYSSGRPGDPRPCSLARVQWVVGRQCRALAISALGRWCDDNEWDEDHAHGIREVIEREDWLSPYAG